MELFKASNQWSTRPADERFSSLEELYAACKAYAQQARTKDVPYSTLRVEPRDGEIVLTRGENEAKFTNWAFGQLCSRVAAPASFLRDLPPTLAANVLNHRLKERGQELDAAGPASMLFHLNGGLMLRALVSQKYSRIWNYEVCERLLPLKQYGWRVPPARPALENQPGARPATQEDILQDQGFGLSIRVGDMIAPAGLYASDHDLFAFLVNESARIADPGNSSGLGLSRGVFVENSEVGASAFRVTRFLYNHVCGNHIVWGASNVREISIRHVGDFARGHANYQLQAELRHYAEESASDTEAKIARARTFQLAASKDEVLDFIFGKRLMSRVQAQKAYELAEEHSDTDGSPRSAWGFAQGVTRLSQQTPYADQRTELDRTAGKVLEVAF